MSAAIFAGRKDVTRRVIADPMPPHGAAGAKHLRGATWEWVAENGGRFFTFECPMGAVGDLAWPRETWAIHGLPRKAREKPSFEKHAARVIVFDDEQSDRDGRFVRSSIHMPRWASRGLLRIVAIDVEPLQAATELEAEREGFRAVESFSALELMSMTWDRMHDDGRAHWNRNPWVWRYELEIVERRK